MSPAIGLLLAAVPALAAVAARLLERTPARPSRSVREEASCGATLERLTLVVEGSRSAQARAVAAAQLGSFPWDQAGPVLLRVIGADESVEVRVKAVRAAARSLPPERRALELSLLAADRSLPVSVRLEACQLQHGDRGAIPVSAVDAILDDLFLLRPRQRPA